MQFNEIYRETCSKTYSKHTKQLHSKLDRICSQLNHLSSETSSHISQISNFTKNTSSKTVKTFKSIVIEKRKTIVTTSDSKKTSDRLNRKAARVSAQLTASKKGTLPFYEPPIKVGLIKNIIFIQMSSNLQSISSTVMRHVEKNIRLFTGNFSDSFTREAVKNNFRIGSHVCASFQRDGQIAVDTCQV